MAGTPGSRTLLRISRSLSPHNAVLTVLCGLMWLADKTVRHPGNPTTEGPSQ